MIRNSAFFLTLIAALVLTGGLIWFVLDNYRSAAPMAQENLRGLALTMATAMEGVAARDPSLKSLASFQTPEIAYAALLSSQGKILFHTNSDLVGSDVADGRYRPLLTRGGLSEERIGLGTGETVYEFQTPVHFSGQTSILRLALHTWRSESVMRRARQGMTVIFSLLTVGWMMGLIIIWLLRRQVQQQYQVARQQELARLGEVGAVLAHEIRNPLAGIKGYGQLLQERLPEGRERGFAALIVNEARRLEGLAHDILLYTRSESLVAGAGQPAVVASTVLELLSLQAQEQDIRFSSDIPEELMVSCSDTDLQQLLLNLLTNGLQASPVSGIIVVQGRREGKWVELRVKDNGPGIAAEMQNVLFEPFRTSKARGAGLGLAVCKKIVDGCGGSIELRNGTDGGAECIVRLPIVLQNGDSA
ncbi:MAG: HAMP domain-containing histidine kinase [Proteobacteria bacterium]|nr:HAMP domain-containing histidine kinase [Desulfocapsa sp.]MBU3944517.1 HAMP domain-containing histidine kinase [Pseudomonadota bacterium]MBU3982547.1 HAMP domain-containing histidine kinase [Pseudomonadota bacterium]MBU4028106.1 HAMP domain-containing histidine kinase [Pseudomonadota bacterium]MBU4043156.1 HAMP domain-containing histidine kinase [Pseudomonadota bacterium]